MDKAPPAAREAFEQAKKNAAEFRAMDPAERSQLWAGDPERFVRLQSAALHDDIAKLKAKLLVWNGKSFEELKPLERARLKQESPSLFAIMRDDWLEAKGMRRGRVA